MDKGTNKEQHITITGSGGLSEEEIKKAQTDAETHAEEDKKKKALVEARNNLDNLIYTGEKTIKDAGDKAKDEDKQALQTAIDEAKKQLESDDAEVLEKTAKDLNEKMQTVGAAMYAAAGEAGGEGSTPDGSTESDSNPTSSPDAKPDQPVEGEVVDEGKTEDKKDETASGS
jgi:molecular chaperone DnaK